MSINLKHKKTFVGGVTGSGKSYFVEHFLLKAFKTPLVVSPHAEDYTKAHKGTLVYNMDPFTTSNFNKLIETHIKPLAYAGKIDAIVLDEADLIIPKNIMQLQEYKNIYDLFINHRHWGKEKGKGLAVIMITRRPQEMSTVFIEQAHHLFIFALEGKNTVEHLSKLHADFETLLPKLNSDAHNFIHKEIGKAPLLHGAIKTN